MVVGLGVHKVVVHESGSKAREMLGCEKERAGVKEKGVRERVSWDLGVRGISE